MLRSAAVLALTFSFATACAERGGSGTDTGTAVPDGGTPALGIAVLGATTHSLDAVDFTVIASAADGLATPRDIEMNPESPADFWVVNYDSSFVVLVGAGTPEQTALKLDGLGATHFLARPSAIAFGAPGLFATAQEEDQVTQDGSPADFMGPTLWSSDWRVNDGGHGGHLDMLHNTPNGAGIAWDYANAYWVFDGMHQSLTLYNFNADHGLGGADHTDGIVSRFVQGQVGYVQGVPSHMQRDPGTGLLYVADTGNDRIAVLDPRGATPGAPIDPNYDGTLQYVMEGGTLTTLVDGSGVDGMQQPSGLMLHDGRVYVTDNATSRIFAFALSDGALVDWLDLSREVPAGGLMGLCIDSRGAILVVDALGDRVLRIAPRTE